MVWSASLLRSWAISSCAIVCCCIVVDKNARQSRYFSVFGILAIHVDFVYLGGESENAISPMKRTSLAALIAMIFLALPFGGCKTDTQPDVQLEDDTPVNGDWIRVYHASDPDGLHPQNTRNAYATFIKEHIYMYLFDYDAQTMEHVPTLAVGKPEISADGMQFTYEMRPEAQWDNGDPITGLDYEFSIKCLKNPLTDNAQQRSYHSFIKDVKVDPSNNRRFTVICDTVFFHAETAVSGLEVISKKHFDPAGVMDNYKILDFYSRADEMAKDPVLIKFAEEYNSENNGRDPARVYGSGPYKFESWTPGDNVTLVRKQNWWGDKLRGKSWYFQAYAQKIIFKTVTDKATLPMAAKNDELDVIRDLQPEDFVALREDTAGYVFKNYNFHTPTSFSTIYLGFNCRPPAGRNPVVEDVAVRKALAHVTDIDGIIENIYLGFGQRQIGPISPLHKDEYHSELQPRKFDPEMAKKILDEAGWIDGDGNGVREKMIRGKKVELNIEVLISNTSETGPRMVRMIEDQASRVGINLELNPIAFGTLTSRIQAHDFDMFGLGFSSSPLPTDLKQVWATENWANNGSNYFGFGNATTDSLIEQIRVTLKAEDRKPLYWKFQEIFNEELPVLMIMAPQEKILIHKRFKNAVGTELRPGYKVQEFWVPLAKQKFK